MKILIQRVLEARVAVAGKTIASIKQGALVFVGVHGSDTPAHADWLAGKLVHLRMFEGEEAKMDLSLLDTKREVLIVSQFTLYGSCLKGRRPEFTESALPEIARPLYEEFVNKVHAYGLAVQTGSFGAHMQVSLINDGPVTLLIER